MEKHYTAEEIKKIYEAKTTKEKVKILEKALDIVGSKTHKIAKAMGYYYSDDYNESTWIKSKNS
jgi:hypothetical protein